MPDNDSELTRSGSRGEKQKRMDLLTVRKRELGHVLGFEHEDNGLVDETLTVGLRHTPIADSAGELRVLDAVLAGLADDYREDPFDAR